MEPIPISHSAPSSSQTFVSNRERATSNSVSNSSCGENNLNVITPTQPRPPEQHPALRKTTPDRVDRQESHAAMWPPSRRPASSTHSIIDPTSSPNPADTPIYPTSVQPIAVGLRQGHRLASNSITPPNETTRVREGRRFEGAWVRRPRRRYGYFNCQTRSCSSMVGDSESRKKLITFVISGSFLALVLAVYLALAVTNSILGHELHILLIFMIMILTIVFCHSLIRFVMLLVRGPKSRIARNRVPSRAGANGYAQPEQPIHVFLARDDEILLESNGAVREKVPAPPPAYGLWRCSVRINPDLLYWQRVNEASLAQKRSNVDKAESSRQPTACRPPSYTSDDGIDYVVDAQPRSVAPSQAPSNP